ncbi:MAG: YHS domain-containing protein [Epsilonproteobacteria bacterium]|nr:YHS domain-containing protein [Campylobacterota bacterium]
MDSKKTKDVVCGMEISTDTSFVTEEANKTYYFCSENCQEKFIDNPEAYIVHEHDENCASCAPLEYATVSLVGTKKEQDNDAMYTCPMHPEIQQIGPGTCPKCGMALEPMTVSAEEGDDEELLDMCQVSPRCTIPKAIS